MARQKRTPVTQNSTYRCVVACVSHAAADRKRERERFIVTYEVHERANNGKTKTRNEIEGEEDEERKKKWNKMKTT